MSSTQTSAVTETKTLVITLAVGGAFAIVAAFVFGWRSLDRTQEASAGASASLLPTIVEVSRH